MLHFVTKVTFFRNEYFLTDYIVKVGNFNQSFTSSGFNTELYFDGANCSHEDLTNGNNKEKTKYSRRAAWGLVSTNNTYRYDFSIIPSFGFLGSSLPLPKNVELKLSFDRANGNLGVIRLEEADAGDISIYDSPLSISNCHAVTEYVSSPAMRTFFDGIDTNPIVYKFEEAELVVRGLDKDDTNLRIDAIKGGNLPSYLFAGIMSQACFNGKVDECSTEFTQQGVTRFNLTVDGQSVNGYPMEIANHTRVFPLVKFLDTTSRLLNINTGKTLSVETFKHNFLWSHKFEVEKSSSGWIGIDIKLDEPFTEHMNLVVWLISPCALTIDKYNEVEFIRL